MGRAPRKRQASRTRAQTGEVFMAKIQWNRWALMASTSLVYVLSFTAVYAATGGMKTSGAEIENSCRAKAKEVAADTYRSCVTENKTAQIEKIKADYQEKIKALKADYEAKIQMLGGKVTAKKDSKAAQTINKTDSEKTEGTQKIQEIKSDESSMDIPEPVPVGNI